MPMSFRVTLIHDGFICTKHPNINLQSDRVNRDNNDLTSDMTWLTTAEDNSKWDAVERDLISSRLKQPARPTTPITTTTTTHDQTTGTTKTHDQNEDDDEQDDDDTLLIISQLISINRHLNLHCTEAATSSALVQTAATKVSHDTLVLSATHLFRRTDARSNYSKRQEI